MSDHPDMTDNDTQSTDPPLPDAAWAPPIPTPATTTSGSGTASAPGAAAAPAMPAPVSPPSAPPITSSSAATASPERPIAQTARRDPIASLPKVAVWAIAAVITVAVVGLLAITVGPRLLPYQALVVRSGSMSPTIPTGSVVFYRKTTAEKVKVGDVIVFDVPGRSGLRVTHRVYRIQAGSTGRYFITKGDANATPDDWHIPAVGTGWVATFHIPAIGYVLYALQSTIARLLLLVIPALALGAITLNEIWRERGKRGEV